MFNPSPVGRLAWAIPTTHTRYGHEPRDQTLAISNGAGRSWRLVQSPCGGTTNVGVSAASPAEAWVFCRTEGATSMMGKSVFATTDGGASWQLRAHAPLSPFEKDLFPRDGLSNGGHASGIFFSRGGAGWLWGGRGYYQRTRDGGRTWTRTGERLVEADGLSVIDLWFVSPDVGYALQSSTGKLMKSVDGGRSWWAVTRFPRSLV